MMSKYQLTIELYIWTHQHLCCSRVRPSLNMISSLSTLCHESLLRAHLRDDPYITEEEHLETLRGKLCSCGNGVLFESADDVLVAQAKAAFWRMSEIKLKVMNSEGCHCGRCGYDSQGLNSCMPWSARCRTLGSNDKKHRYGPY